MRNTARLITMLLPGNLRAFKILSESEGQEVSRQEGREQPHRGLLVSRQPRER
jgi:hypothetical protein